MDTEALERLRAFRHAIYPTFGCRRDALVEILDALLTSPVIEHPAHLSLAPGKHPHLGQRLRCPECRHHAAAPLGTPGGRIPAGDPYRLVCGRCQRVATLRCGNQPSARLLPSSFATFPRPAHRRWLELFLVGTTPRTLLQLDRAAAGASDAAGRERQSSGGRADSLLPPPTRAREAASHLH